MGCEPSRGAEPWESEPVELAPAVPVGKPGRLRGGLEVETWGLKVTLREGLRGGGTS